MYLAMLEQISVFLLFIILRKLLSALSVKLSHQVDPIAFHVTLISLMSSLMARFGGLNGYCGCQQMDLNALSQPSIEYFKRVSNTLLHQIRSIPESFASQMWPLGNNASTFNVSDSDPNVNETNDLSSRFIEFCPLGQDTDPLFDSVCLRNESHSSYPTESDNFYKQLLPYSPQESGMICEYPPVCPLSQAQIDGINSSALSFIENDIPLAASQLGIPEDAAGKMVADIKAEFSKALNESIAGASSGQTSPPVPEMCPLLEFIAVEGN
jgi:hypothetical protein